MSILVITVDLECCRCRAKITKVLDCLKAEFCIEKVEFEDNNNKVVVRGKFDAEKLCKKVWCKAGNKVVKEIVIAEVWPMPAPPKPCKPCEKEPETKPEDSNTKLDKCDCGHCNPCKSKPEKCVCDHCKPESKPDDKKKEEQPSKPKTPPPKTEYKLMPCPYLVPYHTMCPSWPWQCLPHQQCQGCQQKPPQPPPPPPPPSPPRPCTCSNHGSCGCGGARLVWPPQPPVWPPPPWAGYNVVAEENSCTVM